MSLQIIHNSQNIRKLKMQSVFTKNLCQARCGHPVMFSVKKFWVFSTMIALIPKKTGERAWFGFKVTHSLSGWVDVVGIFQKIGKIFVDLFFNRRPICPLHLSLVPGYIHSITFQLKRPIKTLLLRHNCKAYQWKQAYLNFWARAISVSRQKIS